MSDAFNPAQPRILPFVWQHLWHHGWQPRFAVSVGAFCSVIASLVNIVVPFVIAKYIDGLIHHRTDFIASYGWLIVFAVYLVQVAAHRIRIWLYWRLTVPQLLARMRYSLYNRLMAHGTDFFASNFSGALANKIRTVSDGTQELFESIVIRLSEAVFFTVVVAAILCALDLFYAVAVLGCLVILTLVCVFLSKNCRICSEAKANAVTRMTGFLVDSVTNHTAVRHFVGWHKEKEIFAEHQQQVIQTSRALNYSYNTIWAIFGVATTILQSFLLWQIARDFKADAITVGDITLVVTYSLQLNRQFAEIMMILPNIAASIGTVREALELIYQPLQHRDAPEAKPLTVSQGAITLSHVDFAYPNGTKVFRDLSLQIPAGQKIGLVGFSGSGKSTLVHLLLRHYDIQSGSITIDDQDIRHVTMDSLRQAIAAVPQDPALFHRTLFDNIAYGDHGATEEDVLYAASRASAHEFIEELRDGYATKVGERGVKLSGGQRQRVAIARAILSDAPILILDEATSALDSVTEKLIQNALTEAMQGRTTIVIAHRLATLTSLDRLIVLDQGRIVEDGTLDELLAANGHFARLWQMQSGGFLPNHA